MTLKRLLTSLILAFLILSLMLSETAFAQSQATTLRAASPSPAFASWEGSWNLRLQQESFADEFNQSNITEMRLQADLKYRPLQELYFQLAPKFTFKTGYQQTVESSSPSQSQWSVREASANLLFFERGHLSAGALDQSENHPALLLAGQTFPAMSLALLSDSKENFSLSASVQSAIPVSSSLSTQTREFEQTPSLQTASASAKWQLANWKADLRAGVFQFQNLPISVASDSSFLGNTTFSRNGNEDSEFTHFYQGEFASGALTARLHRRLNLIIKGEWLRNSQAPAGFNTGYRSLLASELSVNPQLQITPFYEYFKIEPDAAVALYNGSWLNTNRVGYQGGLTMSYRRTLSFTFSGGERDVVFTTPLQQRERTWNLKMETFDVAI